MRWSRFARRLITSFPRACGCGLVLAGVLLSGCPGPVVPVPVPQLAGPVASSRANVDDKTQDRITAGQTTRTEVLLKLGAPDGRAPDDSWFTYGTVARRGGVKWYAMSTIGDSNASQRLLVRFDPQGIVSSVDFSQRNCTEEVHNCLEATGGDLLAVEETQVDAFGQELARHDPIRLEWRASATCNLKESSYYDGGYGDAFVVTEQAIFWRDRRDAPRWRTIPIGDVQDAPAVQDDGVMEWIPVRKRDGSCVFFDVGAFADANGLSEARQLRSFLVAWIAHSGVRPAAERGH